MLNMLIDNQFINCFTKAKANDKQHLGLQSSLCSMRQINNAGGSLSLFIGSACTENVIKLGFRIIQLHEDRIGEVYMC